MIVGVTFFLRRDDAIWVNGGFQNCVFLWMLLRRSTRVDRVIAINAGEDIPPSEALMLTGLGLEFVKLEDCIDELDVLIECGAQVSSEHLARVRARGGRTVGYRFGNTYVIDIERTVHGKEAGSIFNGSSFDAIWTNPQHEHTCRSYWELMYRAPVRILPHIWEPTFVEKTIVELAEQGHVYGYHPRTYGNSWHTRRPKRIAIFEPNIGVNKTYTIPMLVCEAAFRVRPDLIDRVYVTNAMHIKNHLTFQHFAGTTDLARQHRVSFEGRFNVPYFLAAFGDVVVSHQWENGLNYAYYDALWGGYPLVHNSKLLPDGIGYRYPDFDAWAGGRMLLAVLEAHDARAEEYNRVNRLYLETVRATAPGNVEAHERELARLFA